MSESIHTARWLSLILEQDFDIHLFPSIETDQLNPLLHGKVSFHPALRSVRSGTHATGLPMLHEVPCQATNLLLSRFELCDPAARLARLIEKLRPDLICSLEFQAAGYLTLGARERLGGHFPPWMVVNWGSDINLFGKLPDHQRRLRALLASCDFYLCECRRDVKLAQEMGLQGEVLGVVPVTGGLCLKALLPWRASAPSKRTRILLKGYQGWAGRALTGLRALELIADRLAGFEVVLYSAPEDVELKARLVTAETGLPIRSVPYMPHHEMLRLHGMARVSIGLSISDGASTSFLEALTMGSFPVQSHTSCADEWAENGLTALLVPPEDPGDVAQAILRAVSDDSLVEQAAELNFQTARERLEQSVVKAAVVGFYRRILEAN